MTLPPPLFKAGTVASPPIPPTPPPLLSPGDSTIDWYLLGADDQKHGPFTISQLINEARRGSVIGSTLVLHSVATKSEWIAARHVPAIAMHITVADLPPAVAVVKQSPSVYSWQRSKRRSTGGGLNIIRDVIIPMISVSILGFGYLRLTESRLPVASPVIVDSSATTDPGTRREPKTKRLPERPFGSRTDAESDRPGPMKSEPKPEPVKPTAPAPNPDSGNKSTTPIKLPGKPSDTASLTQLIDLDLPSGKQLIELSDIPPNRRIRVVSVEGPPSSSSMEPADGIVDDRRPLLVLPYADRSVYFSVRSISESGGPVKLSIECLTGFDWLGGDTLSAERLRRKRIAMLKSLQSSPRSSQCRIRSDITRFDKFCDHLNATLAGAKLKIEAVE